jgi:hypothetical protein
MPGETNLGVLLRGLRPALDPREYVFALVERVPAGVAPFAVVHEAEGTTIVLPGIEATRHGLAGTVVSRCRHITLTVHSSLEAVGLTAAVSSALADRGIACNVIAGVHHDHLFVPPDQADDALDALRGLVRWAHTLQP